MRGARESIVLVLLIATGCTSQPPAFRSRIEYRVIEQAESIAYGGVGAEGWTPHKVISLELICAWPDAIDALEDLLRRAHRGGQLYALAGLYQVDRARFEKALAGYADRAGKIGIEYGCTGGSESIENVLKDISSGQLTAEYKRLLEWENRQGQGLGDPPDREKLIEGLADEHGDSASKLQCRPLADRTLPILLEALKSSKAVARRNALSCIGGLGPWAETAETAVVPLLGDQDVETRQMASQYVSERASPRLTNIILPIISGKLEDPNEDGEVLWSLVCLLRSVGEPAVPILLKALKRPDQDLRNLSVMVAGDIGPPAKGAMPALEAILRSGDEPLELRQTTFRALVHIGRQPADLLDYVQEDQRESCLLQLQEVNNDIFQRILPSLVSLLKSSDPAVAAAAASCLGSHGDLGRPALAALAEATRNPDATIAEAAIASLPALGEASVPALIELLRDPQLGKPTAVILGESNLDPARTALEAALKDPDPAVRERADTYYRPRSDLPPPRTWRP
jgi:HEAT repeat protein